MSKTEAKEMASRLRVDGVGLFWQSRNVLEDLYSIYGSGLYNCIHRSDYTPVSKFV